MKFGFLIAIFALASGIAQAQDSRSESISRSDAREMRMDDGPGGPERYGLGAAAVSFKAIVGVAYVRGEDESKTWITPIQIDAVIGATSFKLLTDGYARSQLDGETASGITDMTLRFSHSLGLVGPGTLIFGGGVRIPVGGEVGGTSAKQDLQLTYNLPIGDAWKVKVAARAKHFNAKAREGVSQFGSRGVLTSSYNLTKESAVFVQLLRDQRRGAGGTSYLYGGYEFALSPSLKASITLIRGLTSGARDNGIEFDLAFPL